ncbi:MAG: hypothetical protein FWG01_03130 [Betaproteobacteria bacterium]|nr:hypothetical protein [Betaproteobacteria bacterium]
MIATDAGGCAEVVDDLRYMVPVRDADALAAKMAQIAAMTLAERETLGEINRWRVARFDLESICDRWEKIYAEKEGDIQR